MTYATTVRHNHMRKRCYFISIMCSISLYTWYSYSLFTPVKNDVFTPYYQNALLMIFYLCWDTYHMTLSSNKSILFRKDLLIHHIVSLVVYLSYINNATLQLSNVLIMESISLMNYVWRKHNKWLNLYRTCCIFVIRMPLSLWFWLYYNPQIHSPYIKTIVGEYHHIYLHLLNNVYLLFLLYDAYILWQIYKQSIRR